MAVGEPEHDGCLRVAVSGQEVLGELRGERAGRPGHLSERHRARDRGSHGGISDRDQRDPRTGRRRHRRRVSAVTVVGDRSDRRTVSGHRGDRLACERVAVGVRGGDRERRARSAIGDELRIREYPGHRVCRARELCERHRLCQGGSDRGVGNSQHDLSRHGRRGDLGNVVAAADILDGADLHRRVRGGDGQPVTQYRVAVRIGELRGDCGGRHTVGRERRIGELRSETRSGARDLGPPKDI